MNEGVRPHLSRRQAAVREWWANEQALDGESPQERQQRCPEYDEVVSEIAKFIDDFNDVLIAKVLGVSDDDDDLIDSDDPDYVMRRIRELYMYDATVAIVMVGKCTWARKYVDWEIAASLRNDTKNKRMGLMGVTLPSIASSSGKKQPARLKANVLGSDGRDGYARWWQFPPSDTGLRSCIEDAFGARTDSTRVNATDNTAALFKNNRQCA